MEDHKHAKWISAIRRQKRLEVDTQPLPPGPSLESSIFWILLSSLQENKKDNHKISCKSFFGRPVQNSRLCWPLQTFLLKPASDAGSEDAQKGPSGGKEPERSSLVLARGAEL
jgi:hypothetical protein